MVVSRDCLHYASLRGPLSTSTGTLSPRNKSGDVIPQEQKRGCYPQRGCYASRPLPPTGAFGRALCERRGTGRRSSTARLCWAVEFPITPFIVRRTRVLVLVTRERLVRTDDPAARTPRPRRDVDAGPAGSERRTAGCP